MAEIRDETPQRAREPVERNPFWSRNRGMLLGTVVLLAGITAAVWFALRRPAGTSTELVEQQLTFNSGASSIEGAAISRDGKYVA